MPLAFSHDINKAANFLREAVPLMVKNQIPPTPDNYALWYNYVAGNNSDLKQELQQTIEDNGTCPQFDSQKLMQQHILNDAGTGDPQLYREVNSIVNQFEEVVEDTHAGTQNYSETLEQSLKVFSDASKAPANLDDITTSLTDNTEAVFALTQAFQKHMKTSKMEIESLKVELAKQYKQVLTDPLTKAYNRLAFDETIERLIKSQPENFCLVAIDLDHFKKFNDNYGHTLGDNVLRGVAQTAEQAIASIEGAHFSRYGGEEFALLLPDANLEQASAIANYIRTQFEKLGIKNRSGSETIKNITASFGVVQHKNGELIIDLIDRADDALYRAKANGRNQVHAA